MQSLCWISRRKPCFHYGQAVCLKPGHVESPCLPGHPPHVSLSWALPQAFASWGILLRHSMRPGRLLQERHDGFPRSECPLFRDLRMALYAGSYSRGHHALGYCMAQDQFPFGPACQPFSRICLTTLQPCLHSSLSIATCSTGSPHRLTVYRLSCPLLTRVYQAHARGRCFHFTT